MVESSLPPQPDLDSIEQRAKAAIPGAPMDTDLSTGEWEPWFNFHGDPFVTEKDRGQWGILATIATAPVDYGKARAEHIASADPYTVLSLVAEVRGLRERETALAARLEEIRGAAIVVVQVAADHGTGTVALSKQVKCLAKVLNG